MAQHRSLAAQAIGLITVVMLMLWTANAASAKRTNSGLTNAGSNKPRLPRCSSGMFYDRIAALCTHCDLICHPDRRTEEQCLKHNDSCFDSWRKFYPQPQTSLPSSSPSPSPILAATSNDVTIAIVQDNSPLIAIGVAISVTAAFVLIVIVIKLAYVDRNYIKRCCESNCCSEEVRRKVKPHSENYEGRNVEKERMVVNGKSVNVTVDSVDDEESVGLPPAAANPDRS